MPRNFVVLFMEREGSSPIIEQLGRHPDVTVPVFEELDWYSLDENKKFVAPQDVHRLLDLTFRCGDFDRASEIFFGGSNERPDRDRSTSVGFKWRAWGDEDLVAKMLFKEKVAVFHLFRGDLLELVSSLYFSHHVLPLVEKERGIDLGGGGHLQFKLEHMCKEERSSFRRTLQSIKFSVEPDVFLKIARNVYDAKNGVHARFVTAMQREGVTVYSILYEDFLDRAYQFLLRIYSVLDIVSKPGSTERKVFHRVHKNGLKSQIINWEELSRLSQLVDLQNNYRNLIMTKHKYLESV